MAIGFDYLEALKQVSSDCVVLLTRFEDEIEHEESESEELENSQPMEGDAEDHSPAKKTWTSSFIMQKHDLQRKNAILDRCREKLPKVKIKRVKSKDFRSTLRKVARRQPSSHFNNGPWKIVISRKKTQDPSDVEQEVAPPIDDTVEERVNNVAMDEEKVNNVTMEEEKVNNVTMVEEKMNNVTVENVPKCTALSMPDPHAQENIEQQNESICASSVIKIELDSEDECDNVVPEIDLALTSEDCVSSGSLSTELENEANSVQLESNSLAEKPICESNSLADNACVEPYPWSGSFPAGDITVQWRLAQSNVSKIWVKKLSDLLELFSSKPPDLLESSSSKPLSAAKKIWHTPSVYQRSASSGTQNTVSEEVLSLPKAPATVYEAPVKVPSIKVAEPCSIKQKSCATKLELSNSHLAKLLSAPKLRGTATGKTSKREGKAHQNRLQNSTKARSAQPQVQPVPSENVESGQCAPQYNSSVVQQVAPMSSSCLQFGSAVREHFGGRLLVSPNSDISQKSSAQLGPTVSKRFNSLAGLTEVGAVSHSSQPFQNGSSNYEEQSRMYQRNQRAQHLPSALQFNYKRSAIHGQYNTDNHQRFQQLQIFQQQHQQQQQPIPSPPQQQQPLPPQQQFQLQQQQQQQQLPQHFQRQHQQPQPKQNFNQQEQLRLIQFQEQLRIKKHQEWQRQIHQGAVRPKSSDEQQRLLEWSKMLQQQQHQKPPPSYSQQPFLTTLQKSSAASEINARTMNSIPPPLVSTGRSPPAANTPPLHLSHMHNNGFPNVVLRQQTNSVTSSTLCFQTSAYTEYTSNHQQYRNNGFDANSNMNIAGYNTDTSYAGNYQNRYHANGMKSNFSHINSLQNFVESSSAVLTQSHVPRLPPSNSVGTDVDRILFEEFFCV